MVLRLAPENESWGYRRIRTGQAVDVPGIRFYLLEAQHFQPSGGEAVTDGAGQPGRLHARVGDQHHPARAETGRLRSGPVGHAAAEQDAGGHVELAVSGHALAATGSRRVLRYGHGRAVAGSAGA